MVSAVLSTQSFGLSRSDTLSHRVLVERPGRVFRVSISRHFRRVQTARITEDMGSSNIRHFTRIFADETQMSYRHTGKTRLGHTSLELNALFSWNDSLGFR